MKRMALHILTSLTLLITLISSQKISAQSFVNLAGSFGSEMGCSGDWQPDCMATKLNYDPVSKIWYALYAIPPGSYEYKITINNSWAENYGLGGVPGGPNIPLTVTGNKKILFRYNHLTHIVTHSVIDYSVTLAGNFQDELGCSGDWQPDCLLTTLSFDAPNNLWKGDFSLPAGDWEFKVTVDGSWATNYGAGGVPGGPNIKLSLAVASRVFFVFNPQTHIITFTIKSETVVIPGSFQNELGCPGDWLPDCDQTRLTYDAVKKNWSGTFNLPAGNWEFKVALYNSWDENYGTNGQRNGPNYQLNLVVPSNITFIYDPVTHMVNLVYNTTGLCARSFYDANANGVMDYGELPMKGLTITLSGASNAVQYTDTAGYSCFAPLSPGQYSVKETLPVGYLSSTIDSPYINLTQPRVVFFGNVCLGGAGAKELSYWMNKQGKAAYDRLTDGEKGIIINILQYLSLRNADGSDFDPQDFDALRTWMQKANAKNMAYMVSAQLAALFLNAVIRELGGRAIYTPGITYWGQKRDFNVAATFLLYVNQQLLLHPTAYGGDPVRVDYDNLRQMLVQANSDLSFVQLQPCGIAQAITSREVPVNEWKAVSTSSFRVWPNPSAGNFNLRMEGNDVGVKVQLRVLDVRGKLVYSSSSSAGKEFRFGSNFIPGLYFVEIEKEGKVETLKIVKQ